MKITKIRIHNYRSITDADLELQGYTLLVGSNNSGKSNMINAIRTFYDDLKWSNEDFPKTGTTDNDAWIEITFRLTDEEWSSLADKYKITDTLRVLTVRRYFRGTKAKPSLKGIE